MDNENLKTMTPKIEKTPEEILRDKARKKKIITCLGAGCIFILTIVISMILGGYLAFVAKSWLEDHSFIEKQDEGCDSGDTDTEIGLKDSTGMSYSLDEDRFVKVVEANGPGVVSIAVDDEWYGEEDYIMGSGFVIDAKGFIVTNNHVVSDSSYDYYVLTKDGDKFDVQDIIKDVVNDVALVVIDPGEVALLPLVLGDSDEVVVGEEVLAIGSPIGYSETATSGIISGMGRSIASWSEGTEIQYDNVFQTDAAINPGNSGGPLFNLRGEVIGVNFMKYMYYDNLGFALPINIVKKRVVEYNEKGRFSFPYLGIKYVSVTYYDTIVDEDKVEGAEITEIIADSPAFEVGLQVGDIITEVDGEDIGGLLNVVIQKHEIGDEITIKYYREGTYYDVKVILDEVPNV